MSKNARYLYLYLISCPHVTLTCFYEAPTQYIELETGLTQAEIKTAKEELTDKKKAYFRESWVYIPNLIIHNRYHLGIKTSVAYKEELKRIPISIREHFNAIKDSTIIVVSLDTDSTHNTETINNKTENIKQKSEIDQMREKLKGKLNL